MKRKIYLPLMILLLLALTFSTVFAGENARKPAIRLAADRVIELQRTDSGWEGTWYWYVGSTFDATNLTGATAMGLLEAYGDEKDPAYLAAAIDAADFIMAHLGVGATGVQHYPRLTAADVVFLHLLSDVTGDPAYATRAILEWNNLKISYPTAASLDAKFHAINRPSTWDFAFFMESAYKSGDMVWADDAAAILANTTDTFYYSDATWWYALNLAGTIRALGDCGYAETYHDAVVQFVSDLAGMVGPDNSIDGYVQDTAYAVLAFKTIGGVGHPYANKLARWLVSEQDANGGWILDGYEYPEIDGEALRALSATIGTNVTIDGFNGSTQIVSSWRRNRTAEMAVPFTGN